MRRSCAIGTEGADTLPLACTFEPLMPGAPAIGGLLERASDLTRAAGSLTSSAAQATSVELRQLLRARNSYYTNRMEGDHTRPSGIASKFSNTRVWTTTKWSGDSISPAR